MNDDNGGESFPPSTKMHRWEHCSNCDPSFTCYDGKSDCRKLPVGWPKFVSPPTLRDWEKDPENDPDNGCYQNSCAICHEPFIGNKRRMVCKLCATKGEQEIQQHPPLSLIPASPTPSIETLLRTLLNKAHTVGQDDYREGASDHSLQKHDEELDAAREEVMKAINALRVELAAAQRDERQHWTDFEKKAVECIGLRKELASAQEQLRTDSWTAEMQAALDSISSEFVGNDMWWYGIGRMAKTLVDLRAAVRDLAVFAEACSHNLMCNVGSGESALDYDTYEPSEIALQAKATLQKHHTVIESTKAIP